MRIELDDNEKKVTSEISDVIEEIHGTDKKSVDSVKDEIKQQRAKFADLDFKHKLGYISDYYKWYIIGTIALVIIGAVFIRDMRDNLRPTYLTVEMINSYYVNDTTNTVKSDYVSQYDIDLETYHLNIETDVTLSTESFDTMMMASQQKLIAMYSAKELDVVIGPVDIMEGPANCDCYGDLSQMLPADLVEELKDRDYEFYYFDPAADEIEDYEEGREPYFAGIYLDNCSYLNNNGEYGAFPVAKTPGERPVFTIAANTENLEHAIEFLRFLIENH